MFEGGGEGGCHLVERVSHRHNWYDGQQRQSNNREETNGPPVSDNGGGCSGARRDINRDEILMIDGIQSLDSGGS